MFPVGGMSQLLAAPRPGSSYFLFTMMAVQYVPYNRSL